MTTHHTTRALAALLCLVALSACTSSKEGGKAAPVPGSPSEAAREQPQPAEPVWLHGTYPLDLEEDTYAFGAAAHEDAEEARSRARVELALELWGPVAERPFFRPLGPTFKEKEDVERHEVLPDGRTAVLLAVSRRDFASRAEQWAKGVVNELDYSSEMDSLSDALVTARELLTVREVVVFACERRREVSGERCELATEALDAALGEVSGRIQLEPWLRGGIPTKDGQPLQPAEVLVTWQGHGLPEPAANIPVRFGAEQLDLDITSESDEQGRARAPLTGPLPPEAVVDVSLDAGKLFGKQSSGWPIVSIRLPTRALSSRKMRVGVYLREIVLNDERGTSITASAIVEALQEQGHSNAHLLPSEQAAPAVNSKGIARTGAIEQLAEQARGQVDILVLGQVYSEFASRVGARSVWHEAFAKAQVLDAWTGTPLAELEQTARGIGIGDLDAARNTMRELGRLLGESIYGLLTEEPQSLSHHETRAPNELRP